MSSLNDRPNSAVRGLGATPPGAIGKLSPAQNKAILIVAVTTASISLVASMASLRWFLSMKRSFRHHLILLVIISDTFKALWYFVTPVVIFSRGQIASSSNFCQTSGFLLAMGIEAADLSILLIALHTTLYVFRPPQSLGNGGLYRYRYWIYSLWLALPILAASLAFTNKNGYAYVTAGTICYLPKRPFYFRLGLAWLPRYVIIASIIGMYGAIYIYVKVKFKGFDNLESEEASFDPSSGHTSSFDQRSHNASIASPQITPSNGAVSKAMHDRKSSVASTGLGRLDASFNFPRQSPDDTPEWEKADLITTSPVVDSQRASQLSLGFSAADFAVDTAQRSNSDGSTGCNADRRESVATMLGRRNNSIAPTVNTNFTCDTAVTGATDHSSPTLRSSPTIGRSGATDQLTITRVAIRRQLRFLFIYPLIYLLLWTLPFIQHCLNYTDYYTAHPQFGLNIVVTFILALQAGVDCAVFSWRERPWRRMRGPPILSVWAFRKLKTRFWSQDGKCSGSADCNEADVSGLEAAKPKKRKRDSNWWEEEGKKRKDSVWLGTDTIQDIFRTHTRQSTRTRNQIES
jgi:G protein-coupled receptor GPR1